MVLSAGNYNSIHCRLLLELANCRESPPPYKSSLQESGVKYN